MIIRKLEVNGKTVVLTEDVIRELHRQEHIDCLGAQIDQRIIK